MDIYEGWQWVLSVEAGTLVRGVGVCRGWSMETGRMQRMAVCEDWQSAGVAGCGGWQRVLCVEAGRVQGVSVYEGWQRVLSMEAGRVQRVSAHSQWR